MAPEFEKAWNTFADAYNDTVSFPTLSDVGFELGITAKTVRNKAAMLRRMNEKGEGKVIISRYGTAMNVTPAGVEYRALPDPVGEPDEPINSLMNRVFEATDRYAEYHDNKNCVNVDVKIEGPYGVVGIPDHHLNNIGTMARRAFDDAYVINKHPALLCVGIGDWLDNFIVGFLERERRKDIMSHSDSWRLLEHYFAVLAPKMIAAISGNHMDWTTSAGGVDVMKKLCEEHGIGPIYDTDQVRVKLKSSNGAEFTHIARHKYRGNSRFNSVHAITVFILESWQGEDVVWGGHIHVAGHTSIEKTWMGQSRVVHGVQLGSYKKHDNYAKREGFRQNVPFLVPMTIHIPETGETLFFEDMYRGIQVLDWLREEAGYGSAKLAA